MLARTIIETLAKGINPLTGWILSENDSCAQEEIQEALKAAEEVDKSQQRARENCGGGRVITFFRSLWHRKR